VSGELVGTTADAQPGGMPLFTGAVAHVDPLLQIRQAYAAGVRPDTQQTVSEWADRHRKLPKKSSAEPGPWRTDRTPFLREIMDCLSTTSTVEEVVFMKASQIGGTEVILNALGYIIDHAPAPTILVQPTVELSKRFSRQRVDPLVTDTPRLARKVAEGRSRDSSNTMLSKDFPGGMLIITGANSAVGLRSMPAQYALLDEIDAYPGDVDEEGSPIALVEVRQRNFARRKRLKVSSPTIEGRSAIAAAYEASDMRRFYVPCPHCGEMQPLEFARLVWTKRLLPPERAVYECRACGEAIHNHQKTQMLAAGEWRAESAESIGRIRGYHLNALYSPVGWMSWGDIACQFVATHKDPEKYRVFVNTVLGEVWVADGGEAPAWEPLWKRRETYGLGTLPMGVLLVTAGVDVQKDRLIYEVVGWGRGKRSWSIDHAELPGDTADLDRGPWRELDVLLERSYPHAAGLQVPIRMLAIDSGYNTQTVYNWTRRYPMTRVIAVKGRDEGTVLVGSPSAVEVTDRGRKLKRGLKVWTVCSSMGKSELYGWLRLEIQPNGDQAPIEPAGYCHFPQHGEEFFKQLTAEQLVAHKNKKGFTRMAWELIHGRMNHVLDARVYARAAAFVAGLDRYRDSDWDARERMLGVDVKLAALPAMDAGPRPAPVDVLVPPVSAGPSGRSTWLRPRQNWLGRR
jgi:phage terminase large subunit GpA-like protein